MVRQLQTCRGRLLLEAQGEGGGPRIRRVVILVCGVDPEWPEEKYAVGASTARMFAEGLVRRLKEGVEGLEDGEEVVIKSFKKVPDGADPRLQGGLVVEEGDAVILVDRVLDDRRNCAKHALAQGLPSVSDPRFLGALFLHASYSALKAGASIYFPPCRELEEAVAAQDPEGPQARCVDAIRKALKRLGREWEERLLSMPLEALVELAFRLPVLAAYLEASLAGEEGMAAFMDSLFQERGDVSAWIEKGFGVYVHGIRATDAAASRGPSLCRLRQGEAEGGGPALLRRRGADAARVAAAGERESGRPARGR